jgi:hypothetical protein
VTGRILILSFTAILLARTATAQIISLAPSDPKRWDTTVTIGWLGGNKEEVAGEWNDWYDTFATSVGVGRYWGPHLKAEMAATLTSTGTVYSAVSPREYQFRFRALDLSAVYQAFENSWIHPFVGGGVQLGWEHERSETFELRPGGRAPIPREPPRTTFDARPFLSGGTKFYVTERGFIRTDLSAALNSRGATRAWWRIGGGIDF